MPDFAIKRGMVLRTTRAINTKDADGAKIVIPTGTRVKAMSKTEKGLRIKVQDKALPTLRGARVETGFSNVKPVERGRPQPDAAPKKAPTAKKTTKPKVTKDVAVVPVTEGDLTSETEFAGVGVSAVDTAD